MRQRECLSGLSTSGGIILSFKDRICRAMFVSKSYAIALHIIRLPWGLTMWNRIPGFGVFVAAVLFVGPGLIGCGNRENAVGETSLKNRPITSCNPFLKAAGFKLNADATHVGHHGIQCYFDSATGTFVVNILTNDPKEALGKGPPITVDGTTYDTHVVLADIPVQTAGFDGVIHRLKIVGAHDVIGVEDGEGCQRSGIRDARLEPQLRRPNRMSQQPACDDTHRRRWRRERDSCGRCREKCDLLASDADGPQRAPILF